MIWTLKIDCVWGLYLEEKCSRVVEIYEDCSLADLHLAIQKFVDFDNDHLFDFFIGKNRRNRVQLFSDPDDWDSDPYDVFDNIKLSSIWPMQDGMKLFYHFDFGDDWYFQITKTKHKEKSVDPNKSYPALIKSIGPNPIQYPDFEEEDY